MIDSCESERRSKSFSEERPIAVATRKNPRMTPVALDVVRRSSAKTAAATITPKIAVEAFRIAVRPDGMACCP